MKPAEEYGDNGAQLNEFFIPDLCGSRSVFVMIVLAELLVVVHTLAGSVLPHFNWELFALGSFTVQWIVLLSAALVCLLRQFMSHLRLPMVTICCLLVVAAVTFVTSFLLQWLPRPVPAAELTAWHYLRNVAVAAVVASVALRYFYIQHQLRLREQLELQSRMNSLRDRIRPHFLFNTLNSIASLIMSRPEAAERAVEDLSELFRMSLQDEHRITTVADELRLCEIYLQIEKLRLDERLKVEWEIGDGVREQPMPSLVLQPLVENAIYHGISTLPNGGTVRIAVNLAGGDLQASVENPVSDQAPASQGNNIALGNIRDRLDMLYGKAGSLRIMPGRDNFRVELRYPGEVAT